MPDNTTQQNPQRDLSALMMAWCGPTRLCRMSEPERKREIKNFLTHRCHSRYLPVWVPKHGRVPTLGSLRGTAKQNKSTRPNPIQTIKLSTIFFWCSFFFLPTPFSKHRPFFPPLQILLFYLHLHYFFFPKGTEPRSPKFSWSRKQGHVDGWGQGAKAPGF